MLHNKLEEVKEEQSQDDESYISQIASLLSS